MLKVWGLIPGPVKSAQCRHRLANAAMFLRSCVVQALCRGDGSRHSLHASAYNREYNEALILIQTWSIYRLDFFLIAYFQVVHCTMEPGYYTSTITEGKKGKGRDETTRGQTGNCPRKYFQLPPAYKQRYCCYNVSLQTTQAEAD